MASFAREIFPVMDAEGAPRTGLASSIVWLSIYSVATNGTATQITTGGDKPTFTEIGSTGIYIVGTGANNGAIPTDIRLVGFIDCGSGSVPRYRFFDSRYEDRQAPALNSDVTILADGTNGLAAIKTSITNTYNIVNNGTYGNSALNSTLSTISGYVNGGSGSAYALLTNGTYGLSALNTTLGTVSTAAVAARKVATNKWVVASNQLIIYDDNGSSALYTFNLYDANGTPTSTDIVRRVPA
jgi:hypothetical protein